METTTPISKFYKQVDDFKHKLVHILEQLGRTDEIREINKHYEKMMIVKSANSKMILELFYEYGVKQFAKEIINEEDSFFLGKIDEIKEGDSLSSILPDKISSLSDNNSSIKKHDLMLISHIKNIWEYLPSDVKKNIWLYIKVISKLAERAVNGNCLQNYIDNQ